MLLRKRTEISFFFLHFARRQNYAGTRMKFTLAKAWVEVSKTTNDGSKRARRNGRGFQRLVAPASCYIRDYLSSMGGIRAR
jgi:hypothetical protein